MVVLVVPVVLEVESDLGASVAAQGQASVVGVQGNQDNPHCYCMTWSNR
jgi:hypothetical protein